MDPGDFSTDLNFNNNFRVGLGCTESLNICDLIKIIMHVKNMSLIRASYQLMCIYIILTQYAISKSKSVITNHSNTQERFVWQKIKQKFPVILVNLLNLPLDYVVDIIQIRYKH